MVPGAEPAGAGARTVCSSALSAMRVASAMVIASPAAPVPMRVSTSCAAAAQAVGTREGEA